MPVASASRVIFKPVVGARSTTAAERRIGAVDRHSGPYTPPIVGSTLNARSIFVEPEAPELASM
jgi:hypothetical protein